MNFNITSQEGLNYSKISGDNNKIHTNDLYGYNSIFGEKICHGCFIILKFIKIIKIYKLLKDKKKFSIKVLFFKHFKYDQNIEIKRKKNNFQLFQEKILIAEIKIYSINIFSFESFKSKKFLIKCKKLKLKSIEYKLTKTLNNLSRYVGRVYPGLNSILNEINLNYNSLYKFGHSEMKIFSKRKDKRAPIILNKLYYDKFLVDFVSSERPILKIKRIKPKKYIIKKIKKIKDNVLILGASQGIGSRLLDILSYNKKIKIIASFNKNSIKMCNDNIKKVKIDVEKDFHKISKIIKKYNPIKIYYFIAPKIFLDKKLSKKNKFKYEKLFVGLPLKIINKNKFRNISFFYPSTIFVKDKNNLDYSKIKKKAEIKLNKSCKKNHIKLAIFRFPILKSRQTLSFLNNDTKDLVSFLNNNKLAAEKLLN